MKREAYIERLLSEASDVNGSRIREYITAKRASGLKTNSLTNLTVALCHLDTECQGTFYRDLSEAELVGMLDRMTRKFSRARATSWAGLVRGCCKWDNDDETPRHVLRGLKRPIKSEFKDIEPVFGGTRRSKRFAP